jgi:hypothetical protein
MRTNLIELTETWAIRVTICSNPETVCEGREIDFPGDVTRRAVDAGQVVVMEWTPGCQAANEDSFFPHWHGGTHYTASYKCGGLVAAELYHRTPEAQDVDDLIYGEWEWTGRKGTPRILQDGAEALVIAVAEAMSKALDEAGDA